MRWICHISTLRRIHLEHMKYKLSLTCTITTTYHLQLQQFSNIISSFIQNEPISEECSHPVGSYRLNIMSSTCTKTSFPTTPRYLHQPLFARTMGPFSKSYFIAQIHELLLQAGIPTHGFSGHSIRKGAA